MVSILEPSCLAASPRSQSRDNSHLQNKLRLKDLAGVMHPYPTYSTVVQQMAADVTVDHTLAGAQGKVIRGLSKLLR